MPTKPIAACALALVVTAANAEPPRYRSVLITRLPTDAGLWQRAWESSADLAVGTLRFEVGVWSRGFVSGADGAQHILHPLPGHHISSARAVTDSALVVGESAILDGHHTIFQRATVWIDGDPVPLGDFGGTNSAVTDATADGLLIGHAEGADGVLLACLWHGLTPHALPLPQYAEGSIGHAISDTGYACGTVLGVRLGQAIRWLPDGTHQVLPMHAEHVALTEAVDINDRGDTLVFILRDYPVTQSAAIWRSESIDPITIEEFVPAAINNHADAVGLSLSPWRPLFVDADGAVPLSSLIDEGPTEIVYADDIDDDRRITATARVNGRLRAVVLEPISGLAPRASTPAD